MPYSAASAARPATAFRASCTPSPTPRCSRCGRRSSTRTSPCSRTRRPSGSRRTSPAPRSPRSWSSARARRRGSPARSWSSPAGRRTRPSSFSFRRATSIRTASPTAPTRSVATSCSTTAWRYWRCRTRRTRPIFQKTLGLNDFYFGSDDFDYPLGNIQMVGKSQAPMFRGEKPGETKLAPEWTLERVARHAVDFWLSTEDLPSPDNRAPVDRDGNSR